MRAKIHNGKVSGTIGGYCNRLLRVDLTSGRCSVTPLPDEGILRKYVGGIGLGMSLLLDEMRPGQPATDPETPLIMMAGPLAGTSAPSSSSLAVVTLNYERPGSVATGCSGGYWAAYLKHAGYDGVVVTGRASKPVFLSIEDENVAICDASALWGLDTGETDRLVRRSLYDQPKISVACIGPAGEAQLLGATIRNDRNYGVHSGGAGAVMGSKRLKAIAVRGSKRVAIKNRDRFDAVARVWSDAIARESTSLGAVARRVSGVRDFGCVTDDRSQALVGESLAAASSATAFRKQFAYAAANTWTVVPRGCFNCRTFCAYDCHVNEGELAGTTARICGCSERAGDAAAMLRIDDASAAIALTEYFHALGIDSTLVGARMARAFEMFDRGVLSLVDTEGLELVTGSFEAAKNLLDQIVGGRGFGRAEIGKGFRQLDDRISATPNVLLRNAFRKGNFNKDQARLGSMAVRIGLSEAGIISHARVADCGATNLDGGRMRVRAPLSRRSQGDQLSHMRKKRLWESCLGVCVSAYRGVKDVMEYSTQALGHATGWGDFSPEEAILVGDRVAALRQLVESRNKVDCSDGRDADCHDNDLSGKGGKVGLV